MSDSPTTAPPPQQSRFFQEMPALQGAMNQAFKNPTQLVEFLKEHPKYWMAPMAGMLGGSLPGEGASTGRRVGSGLLTGALVFFLMDFLKNPDKYGKLFGKVTGDAANAAADTRVNALEGAVQRKLAGKPSGEKATWGDAGTNVRNKIIGGAKDAGSMVVEGGAQIGKDFVRDHAGKLTLAAVATPELALHRARIRALRHGAGVAAKPTEVGRAAAGLRAYLGGKRTDDLVSAMTKKKKITQAKRLKRLYSAVDDAFAAGGTGFRRLIPRTLKTSPGMTLRSTVNLFRRIK